MRRFTPLALFFMFILAACGTPAAQTATLRQEQVVDGITIGFEAADNASINTEQEFVITLADADGTPIEDASVYLDLTMPAMPMGTNRPVALYEGAGRYRTSTAYTMSGDWDIAVIAEVAGVEHRAVFQRVVTD